MEVQFKRQYVSKKQYAVGEIQAFLGYAMEVIDLRTKLAEGKLEPGESCMLLFGITPEEYAWKDSDTAALDRLAAELRKVVPADRLIACQARSILGKSIGRAVRPVTSGSIDDGAFAKRMAEKVHQARGPIDEKLLECRRLQNLCKDKNAPEGVKVDFAAAKRDLCAALRSLDKIYAAYDALIKGEWPSIGYDLHVELFTTRQRAETMQQRMKAAHGGMDKWKIREIPQNEIEAFILKLADDGVGAVRIDNSFVAAEVSIADLHSGTAPANANLRMKLLAQVQFALRYKYLKENNGEDKYLRSALESMLTMRNLGEWQMGNAVLYAICLEKKTGSETLCTAEAAKKLDPAVEKKVTLGMRNVLLNEPGGSRRFLAVFTTPLRAATLCERMHEDAVPVAMTFDDLVARAQAGDGIIIDPESFSYRVLKAEFDRIRDLRGKPPQIVRVKAEEKPAAEKTGEEALPNPDAAEKPAADAGSLPDPDAFEAEQPAPETEEVPVEVLQPDEVSEAKDKNPEKKGFFNRLFGKE